MKNINICVLLFNHIAALVVVGGTPVLQEKFLVFTENISARFCR